jgi:hypothetical protein
LSEINRDRGSDLPKMGSINERSIKMIKKRIALLGILLISILLAGCNQEPPKPDAALSVAELLENPIYDTQTRVYGQVHGLGEFECKCFALKSGGEQIYVWFDMMVEEDGSPRPPTRVPIDIEGIENNDWIVVTGELKYFEDFKVHKDFWLNEFEVIQKNK